MGHPGPRLWELSWYEKNGRYCDRVTNDSYGVPYVIGDWAWNKKHPNKQEIIENRLSRRLDEQRKY